MYTLARSAKSRAGTDCRRPNSVRAAANAFLLNSFTALSKFVNAFRYAISSGLGILLSRPAAGRAVFFGGRRGGLVFVKAFAFSFIILALLANFGDPRFPPAGL